MYTCDIYFMGVVLYLLYISLLVTKWSKNDVILPADWSNVGQETKYIKHSAVFMSFCLWLLPWVSRRCFAGCLGKIGRWSDESGESGSGESRSGESGSGRWHSSSPEEALFGGGPGWTPTSFNRWRRRRPFCPDVETPHVLCIETGIASGWGTFTPIFLNFFNSEVPTPTALFRAHTTYSWKNFTMQLSLQQ